MTRHQSIAMPLMLDPSNYPALGRHGVRAPDLGLLAYQGFVHKEVRGGRMIHKLRFRDAQGRQRVRNLTEADVTEVRSELVHLQARVNLRRRLATLNRKRLELKRVERRLIVPLVHAAGLTLHGYTVRAPRFRIVHNPPST